MAKIAKSKTVKSSQKNITKKPDKKPMTGRQKLMSNKTTSTIPKTPRQKKIMVATRKLVAKLSGAQSEDEMPWGLNTHIYENAKKVNKIPKPSDIKKAKRSPTIAAYKTKKNPKGLKRLANK